MFGLKKTEQNETIVDTNPEKIEELLTRGIERIYPNINFLKAKMLRGEKVTLYLGIDPTGKTLHLGHVIPLKKLAAFQKLGHHIILLMGDFTAMIGDPTDKTAARKQLTREEVLENLKEYKKQASKFISFTGNNPASFKFNSEWLDKLSYKEGLELASLMTVQQMLERDMFKKRIESHEPIYIHEFMYPLMQGYDSVAMDVDGEIGGNDQTWNMLAGRDILKALKNKEKFVVATRLLTDSTGKKMGKTENNMVALNQTPEDMFGKVMSWSDDLLLPGFEIVTDVSLSEILSIKKSLGSGSNPRDFKIKLAREIVSMCHGEKEAQDAQENFEKTFAKGGVPDDVLELIIATGTLLVDVLLSENIISSKNEWRRLVEEGAVTNMHKDEKIHNVATTVESGVYKIGKRRFVKIQTQ